MEKGYKFTEEQKAKRYSPEVIAKISTSMKGKLSPFKGVTGRWNEEQLKKISEKAKNRKFPPSWYEKQSKRMKGCVSPMKGKHHSEEHKQAMRERVGEKSPGWRGGKMKEERYHILNKYGLTTESYNELLKKQNGVCAICKRPEALKRSLSIDHDHRCCPTHKSCGKCIRGLLCFRCNQAIGLLNDDVFILESARLYLQRTA